MTNSSIPRVDRFRIRVSLTPAHRFILPADGAGIHRRVCLNLRIGAPHYPDTTGYNDGGGGGGYAPGGGGTGGPGVKPGDASWEAFKSGRMEPSPP